MSIDTFYSSQNRQGEIPYLIIDQAEQGKGVKARQNLPASQVLVNIGGPTMTYWETLAMGGKESYCLQVAINKYIKPNFPFFLFNHSCDPNCGITESFQLMTLRNIKAGEELCWDYSTSMLARGWTLNCKCGAPCCRKKITDFDRLPKLLQQRYLSEKIVLPFIKEYLSKK